MLPFLSPLPGSSGYNRFGRNLDIDSEEKNQEETVVQIGKYVRVEKIGEGGMAQVWKAWDPELERFVALKIIREGTEEERKRFLVEARAAGALRHPNITGVHDYGNDQGFSYIALDYIDGPTSWDARPDLRRAVEIVRDSARGVQHAHDKGIIHRDIKPGNILISSKGQTCVTDFGLARRLSSREQLTISGVSLGTPSFMSPEQAEGRSHQVDATTDVYSLGATLYALLTRKAPFDGDSAFMVMLRVIREAPPPPSELCPDVDRDLETIILKCLEKLPTNRYQTATALADELTRYLDGEPIQAVPVPPFRRWVRSLLRKKQLPMVAAALLLFAASSGFLLWQVSRTREPVPAVVVGENEAREEFRNRVQTVRAMVQQLRYSFYIRNIDLAGQLGDLKTALEELEVFLEGKSPARAAPGWKLAGIGWYVYGHRTRAEVDLLRAERELPEDPEIRLHLGKIYLDRSRSVFLEEGAVPSAETAKASSSLIGRAHRYFRPGAGEAAGIDQDLVRLYLALTDGQWDRVREEAKEGWERNAETLGSEEYWILQGMASRPDRAIDDYTKAIERRPHYDIGYYLRGWTRTRLGENDRAIEDFNAAIRINPRLALAYNERGSIRVERGEPGKALVDFDRAIELNPDFANAHNNRGVFFFRRGRTAEALLDFNRAIELEPAIAIPHNNRGAVHRRLGEDDKAMEDFNRSIQLASDYASGYFNRGNLFFDQGEYAEAGRDFTRAIVLSPGRAAFRHNRGVVRWKSGDLRGALEDFDRTLELDPGKKHVRLQRGEVHEALQMWKEAIDDYQGASRIRENAADAFFRLGILLNRLGDREQSRDHLTRCIDLDPVFLKAWYNRGVVNAALGNTEEALADYDKAIELDPEYPSAYYSRGNLRRKLRDFDGAVEDYSRAIELKDDHAEALTNRADLMKMTGKVAEAIRDYKEALKVAPPVWSYRKKVEELVRQLQRQ